MEADLDLKVSKVDDVPVVGLSGDVDAFTCQKLRGAILGLLKDGELNVVINLANVRYIDSSGLGTLVGGLARVSEREGDLAIAGANPQVQKVLNITGLNKVFRVYDDDTSAVRSLKR